jgi:hypothetical protein
MPTRHFTIHDTDQFGTCTALYRTLPYELDSRNYCMVHVQYRYGMVRKFFIVQHRTVRYGTVRMDFVTKNKRFTVRYDTVRYGTCTIQYSRPPGFD